MFPTALKTTIEKTLSVRLNKLIVINSSKFVNGGCINKTARISTNEGFFFVKWNDAHLYPGMFECEAKGLNLLRKASCIHVPQPLLVNKSGRSAFLILEYIATGRKSARFWQNFGHSLAQLHQHTHHQFGLNHHNYIGSLRQFNTFCNNWVTFFIEQRLEKQIKLAFNDKKISKQHLNQFRNLFARLPNLLPNEPPSLLHGDLWSGNFIVDAEGYACIFDPAVYYGHREAELAFTTLFGGYADEFYQAYQQSYPMEPNFNERIDLYNLYPLMVHVNLFGASYLSSVEQILGR